ncbi:antitoxin MazE-like protein [Sphingoaurantiacus capsulatus]|uniref:Antitoxin MazE-like protein n=1 Tax=Sphingoaurantiacus capsulatus TaxID=1771310 RepID=A0ABV7XEM4_9SPHN
MKTAGSSSSAADRRRRIAARPLPGGRELRLWAHDVRSPDFQAAAREQAERLAQAEGEQDIARFGEAAMGEWIHEWTYDDGETR